MLNVISSVRPKELYVLCDGPRSWVYGEDQLISESKHQIEKVDWNCKIHTNYFSTNLGVTETFNLGINWFFENNESGIILESDCLPCKDFFYFCEELLHYYNKDERIWHISGDNHQRGIVRGDGSYYFSDIPHIWGWATWKRAWAHYDPKMLDFPEIINTKNFKSHFISTKQYKVWRSLFTKTYKGIINTWDYQWTYSLIKNNALAIIPNVNLVSNIGFEKDALHTKDKFSPFANVPVGRLNEIMHPTDVIRDDKAVTYTFYRNICGRKSIRSIILKIYYAMLNRVKYYFNIASGKS